MRACAVTSPALASAGALLRFSAAPRLDAHGNGGVLSSQCTVIFGSESAL
jgi:hypothetical protein